MVINLGVESRAGTEFTHDRTTKVFNTLVINRGVLESRGNIRFTHDGATKVFNTLVINLGVLESRGNGVHA